MDAGIEVRNVFNVKGRGAVAIGYLRYGVARVGQQTQPLALGSGPPRVLTLDAVETMHASAGGAGALGLVFRERPTLDEVRLALAPGILLQFTTPAAADGQSPDPRHEVA